MKFAKRIARNKPKLITILITYILSIVATLYAIAAISLWENMENIIRFALSVGLLIILASLFSFSIKALLKGKFKAFIIVFVMSLFHIVLVGTLGYSLNKVYNSIGGISTNEITYSTSLVTIKSDSDSIDKLSSGEIGIYSNNNSVDGFEMPIEVVSERNLENEIVYIDDYFEIIRKLQDEEITYAFLPSNFQIFFSEIEEFEETLKNIRIIHTEEKTVTIEREKRRSNVNEPITFLLIGVDSRSENIKGSSFNGDALMLITFNPQTLNATMLSIPRDTYMPIACFSGQRKNKVTHSAWYGEDCVRQTVENFFDIEVDYTVKMNFKGVVDIVDAVGGIEVEVPYSFCEQNSKGQFGDDTIFVMEGLQKLNGEQALALTRNRKNNTLKCGYGTNATNDFVRGENQQLVLKALLNEFQKIRNINTIYDLLDKISNTMETDMQTNEILAFYNIFKDVILYSKGNEVEDAITIKKLFLSGYDQYIVDYSQINNQGTRSNLYNFIPYQGSINDVVEMMKINLGIKESALYKEFSFNVNEPYEEKTIGRGNYNENKIKLLPSFATYTIEQFENYAQVNGKPFEINYVENSGQYQVGQIVSQFPSAGVDFEYVSRITINVAKEREQVIIEEPAGDCLSAPGISGCEFPNLVGASVSEYLKLKEKYNLNWLQIVIGTEDENYDKEKSLQIISQNIDPGTDIYTLLDETIVITYMDEWIEEEEETLEWGEKNGYYIRIEKSKKIIWVWC